MAIKGQEKDSKASYSKYVGVFGATVVAVNPTKSQLEKILNTTLEKDLEYASSNDETGAKRMSISFWLKEQSTGQHLNVRFMIEDTDKVSKLGKPQFINDIGTTSYAADKNSVPAFITNGGRTIRAAKVGEETLYNFLRNWLSNLNYEQTSTELMLDFKRLIKGDMTEIRDAIDAFPKQTVGALAIIRMGSDGKEYQGVYPYKFLPAYALTSFAGGKMFSVASKFMTEVGDKEYGCKDYYEFVPFKEYDPKDNIIVNTDSPVINQSKTTLQSIVDDKLPF